MLYPSGYNLPPFFLLMQYARARVNIDKKKISVLILLTSSAISCPCPLLWLVFVIPARSDASALVLYSIIPIYRKALRFRDVIASTSHNKDCATCT